MKQTLAFILIIAAFTCTAQKPKKQFTDDIYFDGSAAKKEITFSQQPANRNLQYEFDWMQRGLNDYHRQRQVTFWLGIGACTVTSLAVLTDDTTMQSAAIYTGAALGVGSLVSYFIQEKKLKRACNPVYP